MMKLLYLANVRIPTEKAHGIQIAKMAEALANQGAELELVLPRRLNPIKQNLFDYYAIQRNFKVKKLPVLDLIYFNIPKIGFWLESISFALISFFYPLFNNSDIIYSRDLPILFLPALFKNNLVVEMHNLPRHVFLYGLIFKKAKAIIVLTQQLGDALVKRGVRKEKILVAPDAVDLEKFDIKETKEECRQKLDLPLDKKLVLYTGSFYQRKGVYTLAQATKLLPNDVLVIFVGGPEEEFKKFRQQTASFKNIRVLKYQLYSKMPYFLKAADVLILPNSKKSEASKRWTSPLKMFEYMVSQRPIVASDVLSIREILDKDNALLIEPDQPKSLANGIKRVLTNRNLADRITEKAYQDVENYTWQKRAKKIINFIR